MRSSSLYPLLLVWILLPAAMMTAALSCSSREEAASSTGAEGASEKRIWNFDALAEGKGPESLRPAETNGKETPGLWEVVAEPSAPSPPNALALAETKNTGSTYNLLLAENTDFRDLRISVKVKALTGEEDQGGGPVWRAADADNYYIARWNPLEDNFRLYYVKEGSRKMLASADVEADPAGWHTIEILHRGSNIEARLDGKTLLTAEDETFIDGGMIGLWTKADAATLFDDLEAGPPAR